MKKHIRKSLMMLAVVLSFSFAATAQIVIKLRPPAPVVKIRPAIPAPGHVWVNGGYTWRSGKYIYSDGYWVKPPKGRHHWTDGKWKRKRGGWVWIPGRWR